MRGEEGRDLGGVVEMALDAQGQRFEALKQLKRVLWRKAGAEVAQQRGAGAEHVGDRPEQLRQLKVVAVSVARVRPVDQRLALGKVDPWELAAVDDGAADRRSVAADVFGRRIDHDRRAVIERLDGERGGGVVDDERNAERPADRGDFGDREHRELRVGQRLAEIEPCAGVGGAAEILGIGRIDEARLDPELLQALLEEMDGAAVEIGRRDDVVARLHQGQDGERGRGLPGGDAERGRAAFERGQPLLERIDGRVADARIGEGDLLRN